MSAKNRYMISKLKEIIAAIEEVEKVTSKSESK